MENEQIISFIYHDNLSLQTTSYRAQERLRAILPNNNSSLFSLAFSPLAEENIYFNIKAFPTSIPLISPRHFKFFDFSQKPFLSNISFLLSLTFRYQMETPGNYHRWRIWQRKSIRSTLLPLWRIDG